MSHAFVWSDSANLFHYYLVLCVNRTKEEEDLREDLQFHFMNPLQKWGKTGRCWPRFPISLCLQLIAVILVTVQVCALYTVIL